jgi:hypothetical protein
MREWPTGINGTPRLAQKRIFFMIVENYISGPKPKGAVK